MITDVEVRQRPYALAVLLINLLRFIWRKYGPLKIGSILFLVAGLSATLYVVILSLYVAYVL